MFKDFEYTNKARNFALRFPRLNFILIQINFWSFAFLLLSFILYFHNLTYNIDQPVLPNIISSLFAGFFYGIALGYGDSLFERFHGKGISLGKLILLQIVIYYLILIVFMLLTRFLIWEIIIIPHFYNGISPFPDNIGMKNFYYILLIYTFAMSMVISFINQMNKKFGPGVLLPLMLGRFRHPREDHRIFMFLDLQSSTTYAEKLGHIKFSSLIRDSFNEINIVVKNFKAEIYQYVGDEVVLCWPVSEKAFIIDFYFECKKRFELNHEYYEKNYGVVPKFKAGVHQGIVTVVEVGDIKRDIAYHGDTLNTAARIQAKCNEYEADLLVSECYLDEAELPENYTKELVGDVTLKGKTQTVRIYKINKKNYD